MIVYSRPKDRICLVNFINEKDLPDGQKLLTCSRCKEACYIDRESQIAHWPAHRKVCCSVENDSPLLRKDYAKDGDVMPILRAFFGLFSDAQNIRVGQSRLVIHLFQQLRAVLEGNSKFFDTSFEDLYLKIIGGCFYPLWELPKAPYGRNTKLKGMEIVWAVPGFANYFLSEDLFLSHQMLERKLSNIPAVLPGEEYLCMVEMEEDVQVVEEDEAPGRCLPPAFCWLCMKFLMDSCTDNETSVPKLSDPLGVACMRRMFQTWACPYGRASYPSLEPLPEDENPNSWQPRNDVISKFLEAIVIRSGGSWSPETGEIVPGLTAHQFLKAMIEDKFLFWHGHKPSLKLALDHLCYYDQRNPDKGPLKDVTAQDRLDLLRLAQKLGSFRSEEEHKLLQELMHLLLGSNSRKTLFQIYEVSTDPSKNQPVKDLVEGALSYTRDKYINIIKPNVMIAVDALEQKYSQQENGGLSREIDGDDEILDGDDENDSKVREQEHLGCASLPEEIIDKLCEFAVEELKPRKCSCGRHHD